MYEKIYDHRYSIIFAVLVIAVIAWYMFGGESGGSTGNNNDVQGTVHGVMGDNRELGKSLDKAVGHIGAAERNSNELQKLIKEQNVSYQKGKNELTQVQELLKNSNKTIAEQNKSLETLSSQIKQEQKKSRLKQIQKLGWGIVGGAVAGAIIASR